MLAPYLSDYDPVTTAEGSLDPMGLYSIADSLATILVPGVRERQAHPRFLTATAVGAQICAYFDDDRIARDQISDPAQVYEWYLVEGIVRNASGKKEYRGLPGSQKAETAFHAGLPLSAPRYLKSPKVFGFQGVYRTLARNLDVIDNFGHIGENGYTLVKIWEREQGMSGFTTSESGPGSSFRESRNGVVSSIGRYGICSMRGLYRSIAQGSASMRYQTCGYCEHDGETV